MALRCWTLQLWEIVLGTKPVDRGPLREKRSDVSKSYSVVMGPASLGLGVCNTETVLGEEEQVALGRDLAQLERARREDEAKSGSVRLS